MDHQVPGILLSPLSQCWDYSSLQPYAAVYKGSEDLHLGPRACTITVYSPSHHLSPWIYFLRHWLLAVSVFLA